MQHHLHPIAVHTPNGVLPLALVFLAIGVMLGGASFEQAAFYSLVFVLLNMPFVIATGYIAWQERYKGAMTTLFGVKIGATIVVCATVLAMVVWRLLEPGVAATASRWTYLLICLVSVGAAGLAGHMGGKLVFGARSDSSRRGDTTKKGAVLPGAAPFFLSARAAVSFSMQQK